MKIYTRGGDGGTSGLLSGERRSKSDARFEAIGTLDELNAAVGVARAAGAAPEIDSLLAAVQSRLFDLGADLADPSGNSSRIGEAEIVALEQEIDRMSDALPALRKFILPAGHPAAAAIHGARAVCRRAERVITSLSTAQPVPANALPWLNRLSDLLFVAARRQNQLSGTIDEPWNSER